MFFLSYHAVAASSLSIKWTQRQWIHSDDGKDKGDNDVESDEHDEPQN